MRNHVNVVNALEIIHFHIDLKRQNVQLYVVEPFKWCMETRSIELIDYIYSRSFFFLSAFQDFIRPKNLRLIISTFNNNT